MSKIEDVTVKIAEEVKEEAPKVAAKIKQKTAKAARKQVRNAGNTVKVAKEKAEELTSEAKQAMAKAAAKAPAKRPMKETVYLQFAGREIDKDEIVKRVKETWTKKMKRKIGEIHSLTLYLKPEDNAAYFVINGEITGSVPLEEE